MSTQAIETYIRALVDIATALDQHGEIRTDFEPNFLLRVIRDGFLQTVTETDRERILLHPYPQENFLVWQGPLRREKPNWNCVGWIFPFHSAEEVERSYEIVTRTRLANKSWAAIRQFVLSCHLRFHESAINVPVNLVKVRVRGEECRAAMEALEQNPPHLRYVARAMLGRVSARNYLLKRIRMNLVIGEKLEPYVHTLEIR